MIPVYPPRGSMAAQVAFALPESVIVGAFHHLPAALMEDLDSGLDADVVIFSDHDAARQRVAELLDATPGLHAVIAAPCRWPAPSRPSPPCASRSTSATRPTATSCWRDSRADGAVRHRPRWHLHARRRTDRHHVQLRDHAYDSAHLGHAFVYLTFDVLQRRLRDAGHETRCVRNVTDVDDDILRKARELGVNFLDLAAQEMVKFDRDMQLLNLLPCTPSRAPRGPSPRS